MWIAARTRLMLALPTAFVVSVLVFLMVHVLPGDPIGVRLAHQSDPVIRKELLHFYGLDRPLYQQYLNWMGNILHLDFGRSISTGESVSSQIAERLPRTLYLLGAGLLVSLLIAVPASALAATRQGGMVDRGLIAGALVLMSVPEFWSGTLLALVFGVKLGWLPTSGYVDPSDDLGGFFRYLLLPAVTVGGAVAGLTMRTLRSSLVEALRQDYILLARSQGASRRRTLWLHAMRNAVIPTVTLIGLQIGYLLGGDIIVERLFSYPGLGLLLVESISSLNYPIIQGTILVFAVMFIFVNVCVDLLVIYLEPRERRPGLLTERSGG